MVWMGRYAVCRLDLRLWSSGAAELRGMTVGLLWKLCWALYRWRVVIELLSVYGPINMIAVGGICMSLGVDFSDKLRRRKKT